MKKMIPALLLLFMVQWARANDPIEISIITCAPGPQIYSVFDHSAIHVVNHDTGMDQIFDFGTFDFDTPNFAYKFLKGRLQYHLSIRNTERFIFAYTHENRLLIEQRLNLPYAQKQQIIERLLELYQPENRYYYYSFLEKDCSTDLRDLLTYVGVAFSEEMLGKSKRDQVNEYLSDLPWLKLGVNLILGRQLDKKSSRYESTFLPDYLKNEIDQATFNGQPVVMYESNLNTVVDGPGPGIFKIISPLLVFSVLFIVSLFKFPKVTQIAFSTLIGLGGLIIITVWIFSDHPEVKSNLNLLWCNPLYLLYLPLIICNKGHKTLSLTLLSFSTLAALLWLLGIQHFDPAVIPMLMLSLLLHIKMLSRGNPTFLPFQNARFAAED